MILRKYGMSPEKDVTFLQIGGSSSRYAALESGSIHAAMLVPPFNNLAKKRGFNQLMSFNEIMSIPLGGIAVHTAARVMGQAGPSEILVSSTVKDLVVGSGIEFIDRGDHELRGLDGHWRLFAHQP